MDSKVVFIVLAVLLDGLAGLTGGLLPSEFVHKRLVSLLAFAAGTLVSTALLHLLPDASKAGLPAHQIMIAMLAGFVLFYVVESFLGSHAAGQSGHKHTAIGPLILVGDALHNVTDGIAIAAAFITDVKTGIATTLAVLVHELPQEVGDFSILIAHGYSRSKALFLLCLVQLAALVGAFGALWASSLMHQAAPFLMAASGGGFLYIAAADLLPELQRHKGSEGPFVKFAAFLSGIGVIAGLEILMSA